MVGLACVGCVRFLTLVRAGVFAQQRDKDKQLLDFRVAFCPLG